MTDHDRTTTDHDRLPSLAVPPALDASFRAAALAAGLTDVVFDAVDSPLGELLLAATPRGLCRIAFDGEAEAVLEELSRSHGPRVLRAAAPLAEVERELDDYFDGRRRRFQIELDLPQLPPFQLAVLQQLARVPYGETVSYGELAARSGRPRAARAVGRAMNRNPIPLVLPCHRVIGASGALVGYGGGIERKRALLALEGSLAGA